METITELSQIFGQVRSLTASLQKKIQPLLEEHLLCALKIKQLESKNAIGDGAIDAIKMMKDIQLQAEQEIREIIRSGIYLLIHPS